jgi:hypothetical protein
MCATASGSERKVARSNCAEFNCEVAIQTQTMTC